MSLTHEVIGFVPDREVLPAAANDVLRSTDRIVVTGAYGHLLNGQSRQLARDAAVPNDDSGAQDSHGNPAAAEQLLDLAAAAQVSRRGVGVVEPSRPR